MDKIKKNGQKSENKQKSEKGKNKKKQAKIEKAAPLRDIFMRLQLYSYP